MTICDIWRPTVFAFWIARLGTRCPDPVSLALAAALARYLPAAADASTLLSIRTSCTSTANARCRAAASIAFALAARPTSSTLKTRHESPTQTQSSAGQQRRQGQHQEANWSTIERESSPALAVRDPEQSECWPPLTQYRLIELAMFVKLKYCCAKRSYLLHRQ